MMFNETYTFDVPRKHVQSISLVLTFKQLIYYPGVPRMAEKTIGKCVLGAAAQTDSAQLHWREMIMNARKPIIQWQALWWSHRKAFSGEHKTLKWCQTDVTATFLRCCGVRLISFLRCVYWVPVKCRTGPLRISPGQIYCPYLHIFLYCWHNTYTACNYQCRRSLIWTSAVVVMALEIRTRALATFAATLFFSTGAKNPGKNSVTSVSGCAFQQLYLWQTGAKRHCDSTLVTICHQRSLNTLLQCWTILNITWRSCYTKELPLPVY